MRRPGIEVLGEPRRQVDRLEAGQAAFGIGAGQEQERLDDPPQVVPLPLESHKTWR